MRIRLRPVLPAHLDRFFDFERDPEAVHMAAFTAADPSDRSAFDAHWSRILANDETVNRTITVDGDVVGSAATYPNDGFREVTYWVDRAHWGRGIATEALRLLIQETPERPLRARAASDNVGSLRVLQKAGFVIIDEASGYAPGRGSQVVELILQLEPRRAHVGDAVTAPPHHFAGRTRDRVAVVGPHAEDPVVGPAEP